jgi:hypothetical protein
MSHAPITVMTLQGEATFVPHPSFTVVEEYSPAVVHELTERESLLPGVRVMPALSGPAEPSKPSGLGDPRSRSVSVVCRLCHGDLDQDLYCDLCGVVTLP